jgi:rifampicin phosphotransferase
MSEIRSFAEIGPADLHLVGGKAQGLARLAAAGLPVPPGFCITTEAYLRLGRQKQPPDPSLWSQIEGAFRRLGGGPVAVRSSAVGEDSARASHAGQYETVLGVEGAEAICSAVARCWASLEAPRAQVYRSQMNSQADAGAMAVVVQRLIVPEFSGVLFTRDPLDLHGETMVVEASRGPGEQVVSGRVIPDRFVLDRAKGIVLDPIGDNDHRKEQSSLPEEQASACLDDPSLAELADLGRRVEEIYGSPCDIEWAWTGGRFWLLQARPITPARLCERTRVREEEIAAVAAIAGSEGTVWSRCQLAETLPEPTPMTWAIVRRLVGQQGGLGLMYRDLGCAPDPLQGGETAYDLICGRLYCNLSREPHFYACGLPLGHSFAQLKANPRQALHPEPQLALARAGARFWLRLPALLVRLLRMSRRLRQLRQNFLDRFRRDLVPSFLQEIAEQSGKDLQGFDGNYLVKRLDYWIQRALVDFGRHALKPAALAALEMDAIEKILVSARGRVQGHRALTQAIAAARLSSPENNLAGAIRGLADGSLTRAEFLKHFGHRGGQEMELAQPRWSENPTALDRDLARSDREPLQPIDVKPFFQNLSTELGLTPARQADLQQHLHALQDYLGLRETARDCLMRAYAQIRRILVELDRRFELDGGIFHLTLEELPRLLAGDDLTDLIRLRRRRRAVALSLEAPPVLFSDDLQAIGRPADVAGATVLHGTGVSPGLAEGPAWIADPATKARRPEKPYVLVCAAGDPAWVPLFVGACAVVMETGGILSHGAIVAREFGLPAVCAVPGFCRSTVCGQRLRVDGTNGTISFLPSR